MPCCVHMPMRMNIHVCMFSALEFAPYEPSVLHLVAVMATGQQDAGSWKMLHALLLGVSYRLSGAAWMLSCENRMLHDTYAMKMHVRGHGHVAFKFQSSACV